MHLARRAWCRTYQTVFRIALPVLPYTEPRILEHAEDVPAVLQKRSIQKVLIVTDPGIARLGLTASLERALTAQGIGVTVYAETRMNPTVSNVEEAAALYRENDCRAIIGFGGGSAMDCAKGVGARIAQPNKPINKMRGLLRIHRRLPLLIAVPTTAGTGSEVTLAAVITDDETHYKYPINDFVLIPHFAVHDPEFTRVHARLHYGADGHGRPDACRRGLYRAKHHALYAQDGTSGGSAHPRQFVRGL